jgi:hypothetical protein
MARAAPLVLAVLLLALPPVVADLGPPSLRGAVEEGLRFRLGGALPATLVVDGGFGPREVPYEEAWAMLVQVAGPRTAGGMAAGTPDVGYGVRTGPIPCYVAAVVTAYGFTAEDALHFGTPQVAVPDRAVPCGAGFRSWIGDAPVQVAPGAAGVEACVALEGFFGAYVRQVSNCHFDAREATVHGRVGFVDVRFCEPTWCFVLQQAFGGTVNGPRQTDAAVLVVE